jgi:hypothetical protein
MRLEHGAKLFDSTEGRLVTPHLDLSTGVNGGREKEGLIGVTVAAGKENLVEGLGRWRHR